MNNFISETFVIPILILNTKLTYMTTSKSTFVKEHKVTIEQSYQNTLFTINSDLLNFISLILNIRDIPTNEKY